MISVSCLGLDRNNHILYTHFILQSFPVYCEFTLATHLHSTQSLRQMLNSHVTLTATILLGKQLGSPTRMQLRKVPKWHGKFPLFLSFILSYFLSHYPASYPTPMYQAEITKSHWLVIFSFSSNHYILFILAPRQSVGFLGNRSVFTPVKINFNKL